MQSTFFRHRFSSRLVSAVLPLVALGMALLVQQPVQAQTLNSAQRGWYLDNGMHNALNNNYLVGNIGNGGCYCRNWFVFNVPSLPSGAQYVTATLRVKVAAVISDNYTAETYTLRGYTGSLADLVSENGNGNGVAVYNGLAGGPDYGSITITPDNDGGYVNIVLNWSALAAINASAGGQFAIGGLITSVDDDDYTNELVFAGSGSTIPNDGDTQLILVSQSPSLLQSIGTRRGR